MTLKLADYLISRRVFKYLEQPGLYLMQQIIYSNGNSGLDFNIPLVLKRKKRFFYFLLFFPQRLALHGKAFIKFLKILFS